MHKLLNKHQLEERVSLDITTIYRKIKAGTFPKPVRVGKRAVRWRSQDIDRWEDHLEKGTGIAGPHKHRGVAQAGSAPALGAGGRGFKSHRPDHDIDIVFTLKAPLDDGGICRLCHCTIPRTHLKSCPWLKAYRRKRR